MPKKPISFDTYQKRKVGHAATKLPEKCRKPFIELFKLCGCGDYYGGVVESYFQVIKQNMEARKDEIVRLKNRIHKIRKIANELPVD